jgi:hypothetical protein
MEDFSDARQTQGGVMVAASIAVEKEEEEKEILMSYYRGKDL